jgi:hypothetical protein
MTFVTVLGDPDRLASFLNSVVASGNAIDILMKTQNHSTYLVGYSSTGPVVNSYILLESGDFLLLESGDKIIL